MKNLILKRLSLLLALLFVLHVSYAKDFPIDGMAYRVVSVDGGLAMTNGDKAAHDTPLTMADVNSGSLGQEWTFISLSADEPLYAIYNANYAQAADMALESSNPGSLLQWELTASANQTFYVKVVDEDEGVVQLLCSSNRTQAVTASGKSQLKLSAKLSSTATHFRLVSTGKSSEFTIPVVSCHYVITHEGSGFSLNDRGRNCNDALIYADECPEDNYDDFVWQLRQASSGVSYYQFYNT